jgi:hypothetical protein
MTKLKTLLPRNIVLLIALLFCVFSMAAFAATSMQPPNCRSCGSAVDCNQGNVNLQCGYSSCNYNPDTGECSVSGYGECQSDAECEAL